MFLDWFVTLILIVKIIFHCINFDVRRFKPSFVEFLTSGNKLTYNFDNTKLNDMKSK